MRAGETAQEPEGDRRQLVVRVGQHLEQRDHGTRQSAHDHARQYQHQDGLAAADRGRDEIDQGHGGEPADEGQGLDAQDRQGEEDAQHGTQPGAGRDAQDVGRDQGVAEQVLVGRACGGECAADQEGGTDPRQPHAEQDRVDGGCGLAAGDAPPQRRRDVGRTERVGTGQKGCDRKAGQDDEQTRDEGRTARLGQGKVPPAGPSRRSSRASSNST